MVTPYDWQEGIAHRAGYVEARLAGGVPVIAASADEGIIAFTMRRQARKIFEIYDRLLFAGIGQQSDIESIRVSAIDFAHQEGFQRSEEDVTIQRVVGTISQPLKRAFADFSYTPLVARSLFAEVGASPDQDRLYVLDYDGDYVMRRSYAYIAGTDAAAEAIREALGEEQFLGKTTPGILKLLQEAWTKSMAPDGSKTFAELSQDLQMEAAVLRREATDGRFTILESP